MVDLELIIKCKKHKLFDIIKLNYYPIKFNSKIIIYTNFEPHQMLIDHTKFYKLYS